MPQSICTHYGLAVGYYASGLLRVLMFFSSPIAWPLSKLLDTILGHSSPTLPRRQLQQFVALHGEEEGYAPGGEALTRDETQIISCALEMKAKMGRAAMTPLDAVFSVASDAVVDRRMRREIMRAGHSRVPVHAAGDRSSIIGMLLVKDLLLVEVQPLPQRVCGRRVSLQAHRDVSMQIHTSFMCVRGRRARERVPMLKACIPAFMQPCWTPIM